MSIIEGRPTLVMIAGFSRAGKDTLANGLLEWSEKRAAKVNFADPLKECCNAMLSYLHLEGEDRKSTRLNSSHVSEFRMPSSA